MNTVTAEMMAELRGLKKWVKRRRKDLERQRAELENDYLAKRREVITRYKAKGDIKWPFKPHGEKRR